ncbi:hypothetical protein IJG14_00130 [bacterium]|nr:hypothetical protein [bacterium]
MKKLFYIIFLFIFFQNVAISDTICSNNFKCQNFEEMPNTINTKIAKIFGIDFLQIKLTEFSIEKYIKYKYKNNINISVNAKSAKALKSGEFRKIIAKSKRIFIKNYSISDFRAETLCPYNKVVLNQKEYMFPHDIPVSFSAVVTNEDLDNIYNELINTFGINIGNICTIKWYIENSKLNILVDISSLFIKTKFTISTELSIADNDIIFSNISNTKTSIYLTKMLPQINSFNPISFMLKLARNTNCYITIENVKIIDDKIYVQGMFIIPKNCDITE